MPPRGEKRGETGEKRGGTGDPQLPASTADETATTGKDGSTGFDLALESNEALAAMDDTAFTRAVTRCLASHRKIFSGQQHNWASVRLAANLPPTLRGVAAEDARRKARSSAGVADGIADRGDPEGCIIPSDASLAAATVRRWENGAASGSAEARSQCLAKTLPAVRNVPPYTSYIYSAHENSYVQDEVRRRLMLRDNEGELYQELSEDEDHSDDSDSGDGSPAPSDSEGGAGKDDRGRRARRQTARAEKKEKKKDAAKRDKEEETDKIEEAAANRHWDRRTDYLIYAAVVCLGATTRCIEAVAENLRMDPKILRARMRLLQRQTARGVNERDKAERARRAVSIAATHEDAKAAHEAGVRVAQEFRAALAKAKGDVKVGEEGTGVKVEVDADGSDDGSGSEDVDEEDEVVTRGSRANRGKEKKGNTHKGNTHTGNTHKGNTQEGNTHEGNTHKGNTHEGDTHDDDVGDETRPTITRRETRGMADATNLPSARDVMRKYSRETKLWNLVAWRFLMEPDPAVDIHGELPPQPDVDPALDSFRTLYCPRCHHYDCNLHGCGHVLPVVKLGEEAVNKNPHPRSKTHMEALKRAAKEAEEAAAAVAAAAAGGASRGRDSPALAQPACGPGCWLIAAAARHDNPDAGTPIRFDPARIKREAGEAAAARAEKARTAPAAKRVTRSTPTKPGRGEGGEGRAAAAEMEVDFLNDRPANEQNVSTPDKTPRWSSFDESYYVKMRGVYGENGDPCAIARAVDGPSCTEVYTRLRSDLRREGEEEAMRSEHQSDAEDDGRGGRGRKKGGKKRKGWITQRKRATTAVIRRRMTNEEDHVWTQYTPCDCGPGGCNPKTCACMSDGNFCEKYCSCRGPLSQCANAFPGCNCKTGTCGTRACPCFAAARECDPDICKRCAHAAELISHERRDGWPFTDICAPVPDAPKAPTEGPTAKTDPNEQCGNMKLYLRQHKHACLGLSGVEGWGCFLKNGARKNELLGEYTGELISQTEADRRGKIYDKLNSSFLFNLNDQWVLDAAVKGNKFKFANHSATPNCYAKVLMARGDHRVGIFAKEHIAPGEELTYDYRYEADKAPNWALKPPDAED